MWRIVNYAHQAIIVHIEAWRNLKANVHQDGIVHWVHGKTNQQHLEMTLVSVGCGCVGVEKGGGDDVVCYMLGKTNQLLLEMMSLIKIHMCVCVCVGGRGYSIVQ